MFKNDFFIDNKPYTTTKYSLKHCTRTNNQRSYAFSCSLPFIPTMQCTLHMESSVYLHAALAHLSNSLEDESISGCSCFVPFR